MTKLIATTALLMLFTTSIASACPDYIMSCYASGQKQQTTKCVTYRDYDGSIVTKCTSN